MPAERFFYGDALLSDHLIKLEDKEFHHLVHVMRGAVGNEVEIVNGRGVLAKGKLEKIEKRSCHIYIHKVEEQEEPKQRIILMQALPRPQKLDDILEKGTELGVTEFWLFPGKLSERKSPSESQLKRLHQVTISALKQCGRLWLPKIVEMEGLLRWKPPSFPLYFGDLNPSAPCLSSLLSPAPIIGFCVGPEKGFDPGEVEQLKLIGGCGVKLNPNILRAETAAIVGIGIIASQPLHP